LPFVVVYDANILYSAPLRDLLLRLAGTRLFQARWTERILDEVFTNLVSRRPDLDATRLARTRELMCEAVPDCLITGWEPLVPGLTLPDMDDCHVCAAAIRAGAQVIVTFNLHDFPAAALEPFAIDAQHPDEFVLNVIDLDPGAVVAVCRAQREALRRPPQSLLAFLDTLERQGLVQTVAALRDLLL
jgi:hypothetical protein